MTRVIILILLSIMLSLNVKAIAVASDYLEDDTLALIEGTSTIYSIRLQNPEPYESIVRIDYSKEFVDIINYKEEYVLPPQSSTRIEFNVTAPKYNIKGNIFTIGYTVHQLSGAPGGGVSFLAKLNKNFKLKVIKNPDKFYINYDYVAYTAIVITFLLYIFWKSYNVKRKKRKSRKFL